MSKYRSLRRTTANNAALETLEPRVMLSADALPTGSIMKEWGGSTAVVKEGSWIVSFAESYGLESAELMAREFATRMGIAVESVRGLARGFFAEVRGVGEPSFHLSKGAADLDPMVLGIEPNQLYKVNRVPNDPRYGEQYWLNNTGQNVPNVGPGVQGADINIETAWDISIGSRSVVVAVIDTGVEVAHPDLQNNIWINTGEIPGNGIDDDGNGFVDDVNGYDFGDFDFNPNDDSDQAGHGTAVAGVIGAVGNNNLGVVGVNWSVSIMGLKIANAQGELTTAAVISAHDYTTLMRERGVNIVASNNSYGTFAPQFYEDQEQGFIAERQAIQRFVSSGGVFVAAAGNGGFDGIGDDNDNPDATAFPASYNVEGVISVAATDNNDALAGFSNYGVQTVDIAAPGVSILTTNIGGTYGYIDGTSFAAPAVAGAVALIKSVYPNASPIAIREALIASADQLPTLQGRVRSGGRLNVAEAMRIIGIEGPVVTSITPGPVTTQLQPGTNTPVNTAVVTFNRDIDPAFLSPSSIFLHTNGVDNQFAASAGAPGDDVVIPITSVVRSNTNPRQVTITFNLAGFPNSRLPIEEYRLELDPSGFRDTSGRFLNGNASSGTTERYDFRVIGAAGENEPNDTLVSATPVAFGSSSEARFTGVTLGNGLSGALDVDLYRVDLDRAGQIRAEIFARRPGFSSTLDSYLRLFNAQGVEIAANDQAVGSDSLIDFFVQTGGTYYIGVSGFGNATYNPAVAGSGSTQSTGTYEIRLNVALVSNDVITYTSAANSSPGVTFPRRVPLAEDQTQGTTTASIIVTDSRQILDVNLRMDVQHTFVGDLQVSLISPTGQEVLLINRRGGSGDNFTNTFLDDEAVTSITAGFAPFTGSFRPENALGAFDGQSGAGTWTIRIVDASALNSGFLNSWSLEFTFANNIFGPFESNDTLSTARAINEINGTGSATRQAFIGDGAFGSFDRDIFRFNADAGTSLTANVTAGGVLNTILRLFDSTGNEIRISNLPESRDSRIENYVFAAGGTYYLAISEGANPSYVPTIIGGAGQNPAVTTGTYTLTITLAPGVSDPSQVVAGNLVTVGVGPGGTFGANAGGSYNGLRLTTTSGDIEFLPTAGGVGPRASFGGQVNGSSFVNQGLVGGDQLPMSLTNFSDTFNRRISAKGFFQGLRVERVLSWSVTDGFLAIDVYLTNTTPSDMSGVSWMELMNPDPGISLNEGTRATANDLLGTNSRFAQASFTNNIFQNGLTVALAAPDLDSRAVASVIPGTQQVRDPSQILNSAPIDPNGTSSDSQLALAFNIGAITAGQTATMRYFMFLGTNEADTAAMYAQVNSGTGAGHLTANPATPATETLSNGETVGQLPYRLFFPEGFTGSNIFTFIPIANATDQDATVSIIARYETGEVALRDQLVSTLVIRGNSRSGVTLVTPELVAAGQQLLDRLGVPYALEVRSDRPVAATFSHYDLNLISGFPAAAGEAFTSRIDTAWSFGKVSKGNGNVDFIPLYNPGDELVKVTATFFPLSGGGPSFTVVRDVQAFRRLGIAPDTDLDLAAMPAGDYGVILTAPLPFVASVTRYNVEKKLAEADIGNAGAGTTVGVIPEGQFGVNATSETIGILNPNNGATTVTLSFVFSNGSAYRTNVGVAARSYVAVDVATLPNFPAGLPYGVRFESTLPVSVSQQSDVFGEAVSGSTADRAYSLWGFGEGFRPGDGLGHPGMVEYLRLYNPSTEPVLAEITISYDGIPGSETFRRLLPARQISEFNVDQFVTGNRRLQNAWFGLTVKAATPIVAYMGHFDRAFPGAFGTLGTPLGISTPIS